MNLQIIWDARWLLLDSFLVTVYLSVSAIVGGTIVGVAIAIFRMAGVRPVNVVLRAYIELFRGTPLLMQLFFIYFGLPLVGLQIERFPAAFIALTLFTSAFVAEVFRSGIEAVPRGQTEAATALGMSFYQRLAYITLPQALRIALPSLIGVYVSVIKDTSLATVIGYNELTRRSMELLLRYGHPLEFLLTVAALYFVICYPISKFSERLERRLSIRSSQLPPGVIAP
jgi:polar amino acid transport system permease protein